jgi:serine phosphatase RsbU (regulator of sigma subunit)
MINHSFHADLNCSKHLYVLVLLVSVGVSSWSQNATKTDSLMLELSKCPNAEACLSVQLDACDYLLFANPAAAEEVCQDALHSARELQDTSSMAKALNYNGILATIQSRYLTGIEKFQEALTLYEILNDDVGINKLLNNIGVIHSSLENFEEAIKFYQRSLQLNIAKNDHEGAAFNLHNMASDYLQLNDYEKARYYADSLVRYQDQHGVFLQPFRLFGEWYLQQDILDSAEFYLQRSIDYMREIDEEHQLAGAYLSLADVYRKRKNFARAHHFVNRAETTARRNNVADALVSVYDLMAKIFYDQSNFEKAYTAQSTYLQLKDSLDSVNNFNRISELNARFETERKEKEIAEKEALIIQKEASERLQVRVFSLIVAFIIVILGLVSYSLIRKKRINRLLNEQNNEITEQRQKIISSINYAKKIQNAILLPEAHIRKRLPDSFVFFRPKDIVSGDFYWFAEVDESVMIATIDCTGHGVPGAFMSLIANSKLNKVVIEMGLRDPGEILNLVHREIIESLNQNNEFSDTQDGMDMTLCVIGKAGEPIRYAGAQNPIMVVQKGEVTEYKADNLSIGGTFFRDTMSSHQGFTTREIEYQKGAAMFMFTDGFVDQFGGEGGKKFNKKRFRELLLGLSAGCLSSSAEALQSTLDQWRGTHDQLDDIMIIGLRLQ